MKTLAANMRHAARNHETVSIGGGLFGPSELTQAAAILAAHAEPLPDGVCYRVTMAGFPIELKQENARRRTFTVSYGADVRRGLTYAQAAAALGQSIMHALACESRLNNSGA